MIQQMHTFYTENRKRFTAHLHPKSIAVFHSNDLMPRNGDQFYPFRQNSGFLYLTGIDQEESILLLAPDHPDPDMRELLFLIETNEKIATWEGPKYSKKEASEISGIENVHWLDAFESALQDLIIWSNCIYLNNYEYPKYKTEVLSRNLRFSQKIRQEFPGHRIERAAPVLSGLRMIKKEEEVNLIKEAIKITGKSFERMLRFVRPGVNEFHIQAEMAHEFSMNGARDSAYAPIIASGKNACILHYTKNNAVCKDGELLLCDFGAEYRNYAADISRTFPVNGKFSSSQRDLYNLVLRVQKRAIAQMLPGVTLKQYNETISKFMEQELISIGLLREHDVRNQDPKKPLVKKYFKHGTAHHLGLDVHDVFDKHQPFAAGMVLTCEPGLYIPEENTGIRIENNILITDDGPVDLSEQIPREVDDLEELMK
jgi:Xaa-Pro aminopeptidase